MSKKYKKILFLISCGVVGWFTGVYCWYLLR